MDKKVFVKQLEALVAEIAAQNGTDLGLARGLLGMMITKHAETLKASCKIG
jgi:hypothetical protein